MCSTQNSVEMTGVSHSNNGINDKVHVPDSRELAVDRQAAVTEIAPMVVTDVKGKIPTSFDDVTISSLKYTDVSVAVDEVNVVENISGVCGWGGMQCD